ncbi:MAG: hypothetical protein ACJ8CR_17345 [Roseiflexaceae bacterium]
MSRFTSHWPQSALAICVLLVVALGPVWPSNSHGAAAPTDTPTAFATEAGVLRALAIRDSTVFWGGSCANEILPPSSFVRSRPASDGPVRTLFAPPGCDTDQMASNLAIDDGYVYWIDPQGRLMRQRRAAAPGEAPSLVIATQAGMLDTAGEVAVDTTYVYWLETHLAVPGDGRIVRIPKGGGSAVIGTITGMQPRGLRVDSAGLAYFIGNKTLYRATPNGASFTIQAITAVGRTNAFTLDDTTLYWIERDASGPALLVRSAPLGNPTAVTPRSTVDGADAPTVTSMAVDAANLYWVERRIAASISYSIVRQSLAGGDPVIIAGYGPANYEPADLVSSGRFLFWLYASQVFRLPVTAGGLDLMAKEVGLEVVQVIQRPGNDVPLTQGKDTYVRVYLRLVPDSAGLTSVALAPAALLTGTRNGQRLPGSPLQPIRGPGVVTTAPIDRTQFANSALFRLPPDWTTGTVTLNAVINPRHVVKEGNNSNNTASATVTFQHVPTVCLLMVPVETVAGTISSPSPSLTRHFNRAASVWPVASFQVGFDGGPALRRPRIPFGISGSDPYDLKTDFEMGYLLWNLTFSYMTTGQICAGAGTVLVAAVPDAGRYGMSSALSNVIFFLTNEGSDSVNQPDGGIRGLAHELAHQFGRAHVGCPASGPNAPDGPDGSYPYPVCQFDAVGPAQHIGFDTISQKLLIPATTADYMSYSSGALWSSDYTYRALFSKLQSGASVARAAPSAAAPLSGDKLLISGMIGSAPLIGYAYRVGEPLLAQTEAKIAAGTLPSLEYQLRTFDAAGKLLGTSPLRVSDTQNEGSSDWQLFFNLVDANPEPARIEVVKVGGPVVLARAAGVRPPSVAITSPASGAVVGSRLEIAWTAADPDGDPLMFFARYSPDKGTTWHALGSPTTMSSLSVDLAGGLPGGREALVQVVASDGLHSTVATSSPFSVPNRPPQVGITDATGRAISVAQPADAPRGEPAILRAFAYDPEDGDLSGAALQWSVAGPTNRAGAGGELHLEHLPPGPYQVTLTATDSAGATSQTTARLMVAPKRIFDNPATPALDGVCDDTAYAADLDPITLRYDDQATADLRLVRAGGALYACFSGMPIGALSSSFVGLRFDLDNSADPLIAPGDRGFFVNREGVAFTGTGHGSGDFVFDPTPQGLTAAVSQGDLSWSAELRIDAAQLGGWNRLVRMRAGHYWLNFTGDDTAWPVGSGYNVPASWGPTALGALAQTISFAPIPDYFTGGPPFALLGSASSGLPVFFTVAGACTVSGNMVTPRGVGVCAVSASQPGNLAYIPALGLTRRFSVRTRLFLPVLSK